MQTVGSLEVAMISRSTGEKDQTLDDNIQDQGEATTFRGQFLCRQCAFKQYLVVRNRKAIFSRERGRWAKSKLSNKKREG